MAANLGEVKYSVCLVNFLFYSLLSVYAFHIGSADYHVLPTAHRLAKHHIQSSWSRSYRYNREGHGSPSNVFSRES